MRFIFGAFKALKLTVWRGLKVNLFRGKYINVTEINLPCLPYGRYDLILTAKDTCPVAILMTTTLMNPSTNWSLIDQIEMTTLSYQNRIQKKQMALKWAKRLDIHAIDYCLVINKQRNYANLCSAIGDAIASKSLQRKTLLKNVYAKRSRKMMKINPEAVSVLCTGKRNRQILKGLLAGHRYFIDIFGVHTARNNITFNLKSLSVWFNRSQPIQLKDGNVLITKLPELGRQAVFHFKVPGNTTTEHVKIQILPCGGSISVKVFKRKSVLASIDFHKPIVMTFPTSADDRFTIKIRKSATYSSSRNSRQIGVSATIAERFVDIPELPENRTVYQISSASTCRSTWIAWHASPDIRDIQYCVVLVKLGNKSNFEDLFTPSFCDSMVSVTLHPQFSQLHCFPPQRLDIENFHLTNLLSGTFYAINVLVRLGKHSLFYNMIRIVTNTNCLDDLLNNSLENPRIEIV